jgi:S-adenosyl-L-methionine hydrolase (adenosine-forming)
VGTERRALAVETPDYHFVGPDNGIFSRLLDEEPDHQVRAIDEARFRREPFSSTFHGRDLFAPAAAALAAGMPFREIGPVIADPVRLRGDINRSRGGVVVGRVVHIDRFGNCVTSLRGADLGDRPMSLEVAGVRVTELRDRYAEGGSDPFVIWGSAGYLEISVSAGSAAARLGVERGMSVTLRTG